MDRLTSTSGLCRMASTEFCREQEDCYSCSHGRKVFQRLASYEDTRLTPEDIQELCTTDVVEVAKMFRRMIDDGSIDRLKELLRITKENSNG